MRGWRECKLADVALKFAMGPFGSNIKAENFTDSGVPVIRGTNLNSYRYVSGSFVFLTEEKADQLKSSNCFPGDIVITHRGTLGQVGLIPKRKYKRYVVSQSGMKVTPNPEYLDSNFLFYFFKSGIGQHELLQHESQVGVPSISNPLTSLKAVKLRLPATDEQKAIASVLSSLDDKIDLLHRQNKTIEALAETLFRKWFNEAAPQPSPQPSPRGRGGNEAAPQPSPQPSPRGRGGMEAAPQPSPQPSPSGRGRNEAALAGWESRGLLDVVQLVGGGTPKTSVPDYWDGDISWLAGGDIATNHKSFVNYSEKKITKDGLNNSSAKLLPQYATVISARGTVGKYCLLAKPMAFSQSNYGILPNIRECFFFTYLLINHVVEELQSSAYGSVFDTITTNTFKDIKISLPDGPVIEEFEKAVVPFFQKILTNKGQIATLEKLRDTLLPKLMSGEVRVEV